MMGSRVRVTQAAPASRAQALWRRSWDHPPDAFAETDADRAVGLAPRAEGHFVAVLEERAGFAARQVHRLLAATADLQKRAEAAVVVGRKRARPDQVACLEIATIAAV